LEADAVVSKESAGLSSIWESLVEFDFSRPLAFLALAAAFVVSRVPWLGLGYGTDPDAWRVALSADHLVSHAEYLPSRLPGFPLEEFATAALVRAGPLWTNLSTVLISLVGVYLFACLLVALRLPSKGALTFAFAFAPLLWINSVTTMDYMWALTFILACYLALIRRRFLVAGLCLGLAVGFRLTSVIAVVPFLLYLWRERQLRTALLPFLGAVGITSLVAFSPVLVTYKLRMFDFYDAKVSFLSFLKLLGKDTLGVVGALAVLGGLAVSLPRLKTLPKDVLHDSHLLLWVAMAALFFLSFSRLPHEVAYLIPIFPFGFFIMARYFRRPVMVAVALLIVAAGFIDITSPGDLVNRETFTHAQIGAGMMLSDIDTLKNERSFSDDLTAVDIPPHSVVFTGFIYPEFAMRNKDRLDLGIIERDRRAISMLTDRGEAIDKEKDVIYVWLLKYDKFEELRQEGYQFFYLHDADAGNDAVFGFHPAYYGATEILQGREAASSGKGTAKTNR
jgi:hypothetical protein